MKNGVKITIVVLLAVAVAATFALRGSKRAEYVVAPEPHAASPSAAQGAATQAPAPALVPAAVAIAEPAPSVGLTMVVWRMTRLAVELLPSA